MSCGVGRRRGSDLVLLWLWRRPAATALIRPLGGNLRMLWERPQKRQKSENNNNKIRVRLALDVLMCQGGLCFHPYPSDEVILCPGSDLVGL